MKEFVTTDKKYEEAKGALKMWRDFKDATNNNLKKIEQEATKDKARKSDLRAAVRVAETPKIQNSMDQYMTANPDELKQNMNLKWTVKEDIMNAAQPAAVQIPAERTQKILEIIKAMPYYDAQKAWVAQAMKQQNLQMTSAVIVKTVISAKVSKALELLGADLQVAVPS
eukprot:3532899-Heterocapsa_arctica.AAC.1